MSKEKSRNEVEYLRSEIRKYKSLVKNLRKELNRKQKREHRYEDLEDREAEVQLKEQQAEQALISKNKCPNCSGTIESTSIGNRTLLTCDSCKWRTSKKID